MTKKSIEKRILYEHAKRELELAGISGGKGNLDQKIFHTVLKLIDTFERNAETELIASMVGNLFATLSQGEILSLPTADPDEWQPAPGLGENIMVLRRCNAFRTKDGGETWYREDNNASGISLTKKEDDDGSQETTKDIQSAKS